MDALHGDLINIVMASDSVQGWPRERVPKERETFDEDYYGRSFEKTYCLAPIGKQPDDYDGPKRFCSRFVKKGDERCRYHNIDGLHALANMKHGMHATAENLAKDFDEKDEALYNWVMDAFPEAYNIDFDADPAARYELHALAVEMVRAERGEAHIIAEREKYQTERISDEGVVVRDEEGEVKMENNEHYLAGMLSRQRKLILQMESHLGIDRKSRQDQENVEETQDILRSFQELGGIISDRSKEYDPDDWD